MDRSRIETAIRLSSAFIRFVATIVNGSEEINMPITANNNVDCIVSLIKFLTSHATQTSHHRSMARRTRTIHKPQSFTTQFFALALL